MAHNAAKKPPTSPLTEVRQATRELEQARIELECAQEMHRNALREYERKVAAYQAAQEGQPANEQDEQTGAFARPSAQAEDAD